MLIHINEEINSEAIIKELEEREYSDNLSDLEKYHIFIQLMKILIGGYSDSEVFFNHLMKMESNRESERVIKFINLFSSIILESRYSDKISSLDELLLNLNYYKSTAWVTGFNTVMKYTPPKHRVRKMTMLSMYPRLYKIIGFDNILNIFGFAKRYEVEEYLITNTREMRRLDA